MGKVLPPLGISDPGLELRKSGLVGADGRSREPLGGLPSHPGQTLLFDVGGNFFCRKPADFLRLGFLAPDRLLIRDLEQEANVVVLMEGLVAACRNIMYIEIEDLGTPGEWKGLEALHPRLLFRFSSRRGQHIRLTVRMPTELQPTSELSMIRKQCGAVLS